MKLKKGEIVEFTYNNDRQVVQVVSTVKGTNLFKYRGFRKDNEPSKVIGICHTSLITNRNSRA